MTDYSTDKMLWLTDFKDNNVKNVKKITQDVLSLFQVPPLGTTADDTEKQR